jgi:hypothetical protein
MTMNLESKHKSIDLSVSKSSIGTGINQTHSDAWLSEETLLIYKKYGFNHVHYIRAGYSLWLKNNLNKIIDEIRSSTSPKSRSELIILLDMSKEGPTRSSLIDSILIMSEQLSVHTLQIILITQLYITSKPKWFSIGSRREANALNYAYGDTFAWEAQLQSKKIPEIPDVEESAKRGSFKKQFICLNNSHRPHRLAVYAFFYRTQIIENAYFSFRVDVPRKGGKDTDSKTLLDENMRKAYKRYPACKRDIELLMNRATELSLSVDDVSDVESTPELIWKIPY